MAKRLKHDIYRALGEYVINRNSRLLNEEQLKVAKEYKPILMKMYSKVSKEKKKRKIKNFVKQIPEYILSFIYTLMYWITIPFDYIGDKADDLRVSYSNNRGYNRFSKARKELNEYAYNEVLPRLEEKETDDMTEIHQRFLKDKGIVKELIKK
ncbi:TPA: hypothetical protein ACJULE_002713 [Staphylococcus aureus]|uniref:hypothetical protein n=1 Tax=Staphylococcus aureus TaxID=1280 RepID=UPI0006B64F9B|nr:hypothetical protein [Staphylococcus aureus]APW74774.1 hypothetical protein BRL61_01635 [Staphylococcus aureus]EKF1452964.1 hypothetical protein [Staphylococcus aureus]ELG6419868.1 hypothetical protein [Staphylococcus aureus]KOZ99103.1 hypothetical protein AMK46_07755 [Staphylococcus aureus]MBO2737250.1 hypothetical protein [Staphylococcus aureus]